MLAPYVFENLVYASQACSFWIWRRFPDDRQGPWTRGVWQSSSAFDGRRIARIEARHNKLPKKNRRWRSRNSFSYWWEQGHGYFVQAPDLIKTQAVVAAMFCPYLNPTRNKSNQCGHEFPGLPMIDSPCDVSGCIIKSSMLTVEFITGYKEETLMYSRKRMNRDLSVMNSTRLISQPSHLTVSSS